MGLYTVENLHENLRIEGHASLQLEIMERRILDKMSMKPISLMDAKKIYQEEIKTKEDVIQVVGTTNKSEVKWKEFGEELEYSKNLHVSGRHILRKRETEIVVGLVTKDHIRSKDVVYDKMSLREKEKIFTMGFTPAADDELLEETKYEDKSSTPVRHQTHEETKRIPDLMNTTHPKKEKPSDDKLEENVKTNVEEQSDEEIEELDISGSSAVRDNAQELVTTGTASYDNLPLVDLENPLFGTIGRVDPELYANLISMYPTDDDQLFVQEMCQVEAKITVIRSELVEEYFDVSYGDKDRGRAQIQRRLRRYRGKLEEEQKVYQREHKTRFGRRHLDDEISAAMYQIATANHEKLVQQIYKDIGVDARARNPGKQQKKIRHVTCETDEESESCRQKGKRIAM